MQNDSHGSDSEEIGDMPIDDGNRLIAILKSSKSGLDSVEIFLKHRGWELVASHQLRDFLTTVIQKKPCCVMIAADHVNPKVKLLPKILNQSFSSPIIGYIEKNTHVGMAALSELGAEYILYPPISGPAIERLIAKIKKDTLAKDRESQALGLAHNLKMNEKDNQSVQKTTVAAAKSALMQIIKDSRNESPVTEEKANPEQIVPDQIIIQKGASSGQFFYDPNQTAASDPNAPIIPDSNIHKGANSFKSSNTNNLQAKGVQSGPQNSQNPQDISQSKTAKAKSQNSNSVTEGAGGTFVGSGVSSKTKTSNIQNKNSIGTNPAIDNFSEKNKFNIVETVPKQPAIVKNNNDTIIVQATQEALNEASTMLTRNPAQPIEEVEIQTRVSCLTIESSQFSGYLIAALGGDKNIDIEFIDLIKKRLFNFLRNHGEIVNETDAAMDIEIESVEFEDWATEYADFLKKSVYGQNEVAMAFFPADTKAKLTQSIVENMLQLEVSEISETLSVDFDLYIFMPENERFLLYVAEGKKLERDQKDRLTAKGVTHLHLRKERLNDVKRYKAKSFLNDKIKQFKDDRFKQLKK